MQLMIIETLHFATVEEVINIEKREKPICHQKNSNMMDQRDKFFLIRKCTHTLIQLNRFFDNFI